jgi:hypothetical protein
MGGGAAAIAGLPKLSTASSVRITAPINRAILNPIMAIPLALTLFSLVNIGYSPSGK